MENSCGEVCGECGKLMVIHSFFSFLPPGGSLCRNYVPDGHESAEGEQFLPGPPLRNRPHPAGKNRISGPGRQWRFARKVTICKIFVISSKNFTPYHFSFPGKYWGKKCTQEDGNHAGKSRYLRRQHRHPPGPVPGGDPEPSAVLPVRRHRRPGQAH